MSYANLGGALDGQREYGEAAAMLRKAIAPRKKLVEQFPSIVFYRQVLGTDFYNLANILQSVGRSIEAEAAHRQSIAVLQKLVADAPNVREYHLGLGRTSAALAGQLTTQGRYAEAERALLGAVSVLENASAQASNEVDWLVQLGAAYSTFGRLLHFRGQDEAALVWYAKAIETLERLRKIREDPAQNLSTLVTAYRGRAEVLDELERRADALKDWDRVLELADAADTPYYRCRRQLSAGQPRESAKAAEELARAKDVGGGILYSFARVLSLASERVKGDAGLTERYAARAVELLRQVSERKYDPVALMKTDPALAGLRAREDFKKLMADLEAKRKAGPS